MAGWKRKWQVSGRIRRVGLVIGVAAASGVAGGSVAGPVAGLTAASAAASAAAAIVGLWQSERPKTEGSANDADA
jgi:hypothetical protein